MAVFMRDARSGLRASKQQIGVGYTYVITLVDGKWIHMLQHSTGLRKTFYISVQTMSIAT